MFGKFAVGENMDSNGRRTNSTPAGDLDILPKLLGDGDTGFLRGEGNFLGDNAGVAEEGLITVGLNDVGEILSVNHVNFLMLGNIKQN